MNKDLERTHKALLQVHTALFRRSKKAATAEEFDLINNEMEEVLHRVNILQRLLFVRSTAKIVTRAAALERVKEDVKKKIREVQSAGKVLTELTTYLAKVDEIIDLAKSIAI